MVRIGINVAELDYFTIGGVLDLVEEYIWQNTKREDEDEDVIEACQSDFDNF